MAVASRLDQVLEMFLDNYMRSVYSILPCEVVGVDYSVPSVDCKPLVYDVNDEGQTVKIAEINDVPLFVYSGQKGKVKITMPVAVGDRVAVLLSDADTVSIKTTKHSKQSILMVVLRLDLEIQEFLTNGNFLFRYFINRRWGY